ncbi:MAG: TolB family protein, partial [Anaerolineales bacterium]
GGQMAVIAAPRGARGRIYVGFPGGGGSLFDRSEQLIGVEDLRWSPDGVYLIFTWEIASGRNEIYRVPVTNPRDPSKLTNSLGNKEPAYSRDGEWIAFTSTRDQNPEIYVMTFAGEEETNITKNPARDMQPDWQPVFIP